MERRKRRKVGKERKKDEGKAEMRRERRCRE